MPSIRVGFSTDLNITGGLTGIGTTNPAARLDVAGQISVEDIASSGGVSTFREYQGFSQVQAKITNNTLIDNGDRGPSSSLSGEIKITGETTVSSGSTVEVGKTKTLTVTDRFAVPLGDTNSRDNAPEAGTTRFNQDFGTLEFFDGINWKTVNKTSRSGRVVLAGGYGPLGVPAAGTGVKSMQSMQVMTLGSAQYFGELDQVNTEHTGCGSEIRGLLGGGYVAPARVDIIQYVTIASASNALDFGNLTQGRNQAQTVSSSTRGIWAGGFGPSYRDEIDYVEISTLGNALDFGDMTFAHSPGAVGNSPTRGVFFSGYTPSNPYSGSEYITISSKGNAANFGECSTIISGGSCGSNTRGIFGGGYTRNPASVATKTLQYVTMASLGNAIDFGNLLNNMTYGSAGGNSVRGVFTGSDGSPYSNTNIDYVSVTSLGNAQDFGDLAIKTGYAGAVSDSHGGLGGF
jgi:hypothetical protein